MGRGFPIAISIKQKLNTRSSSETDIVSVNDCMNAVLWNIYWLDAQGYDFLEDIVYQDNKSAILLENNGKSSSRHFTKHINIRYSLIRNCTEKEELSVE